MHKLLALTAASCFLCAQSNLQRPCKSLHSLSGQHCVIPLLHHCAERPSLCRAASTQQVLHVLTATLHVHRAKGLCYKILLLLTADCVVQLLQTKYGLGNHEIAWLGVKWRPWYQELLNMAGITGELISTPVMVLMMLTIMMLLGWLCPGSHMSSTLPMVERLAGCM